MCYLTLFLSFHQFINQGYYIVNYVQCTYLSQQKVQAEYEGKKYKKNTV